MITIRERTTNVSFALVHIYIYETIIQVHKFEANLMKINDEVNTLTGVGSIFIKRK